jgi:hypothetical protein
MRTFTMASAVLGSCVLLLSGCAGTLDSKYTPSGQQYVVNQAVKDAGCYDASVMLGADAERARDIAKKVLVALDAKISSETDGDIQAQRNRHIGVMVGSGGEELRIRLAAVDAKRTFMTATTKTGFVGGAGQKAWSCKIVDEAVKLATN